MFGFSILGPAQGLCPRPGGRVPSPSRFRREAPMKLLHIALHREMNRIVPIMLGALLAALLALAGWLFADLPLF